MRLVTWITVGLLSSSLQAADDGAKGGDKMANTAAVSARLQIGPPVIGAWFPQENEMQNPDGYRDFLDAAAGYSHYTLLSTTMRIPGRQMTDAYVHDWFKRAAAYARQRGVGLVLELDPRHSIPTFAQLYPKALQQRLWLREVDLKKDGNAEVDIHYQQGNGDAICGAGVNAIALERVYVYERTSAGIEPSTVQDATASCTVRDTGTGKRSVFIPSGDAGSKERKACVIMRVTFNYPALFSPEILQFEADTVRQYADLPLAGLMKDEAGYPAAHDGNPHKNGFWTSTWREADYARRTGGRGLVRDSLLMCFGEAGRAAERQAAINHFMEQSRHRNSVIEQAFYKQTKATFGPDAFVGTHDTVFPYPDAREFERNGLNWWTATRDYAQSDEITPYSCRTSMAKKMGGGVWYNQWYSSSIEPYEKNIWSYALTGGRMNFHVRYPSSPPFLERGKDLLRSSLLRGDCRIRLLNSISDAPVDCPVAVIFGHANVMNWAGPSFNDIGTPLTDLFWQAGLYADLIPSTEIAEKALRVDDNGDVWYGKQRYAAVVLYRPEFENAATAEFFQRAARGKTILCRIGEWTKDFNGKPLDANAALPPPMKGAVDIMTCAREVIAKLTEAGVQPKTPASGMFPKWNGQGRESADMPASGHTRLTDGTVILVAGEKDRTGDPIQETIEVHGHKVTFDAAGVAAVRLSEDGKLEAMAAGGLRHFKAGPVEIKLDQPADVALWRDPKGTLQGVLQGYEGDVPAALTALTRNWLRLELPPRLDDVRLPAHVAPVIGCWFPAAADREPENFKPFLDKVAEHTAYNLLTTSIRIGGSRSMADQDVHDGFKAAAAYARKRGIGLVPELGSWSLFNKANPQETLNMVRLQTVDLAGEGEVIATTSHAAGAEQLQGQPFKIGPARIARVYTYARGAKGIDPSTVKDITSACQVKEATPTSIGVVIPCDAGTRGRQACVLFEIPWQWPDPFSPLLPQHQRDLIGKYADVELAGACQDEYGLPAFAKDNELWCSPHWSAAYAKRTQGRDLLRDMVLMVLGEEDREAERHGAINHYMEMTWQQHAAIEEVFYKATKDIFGDTAFVGTHPTWQPHLKALEVRRNGWNWWAVRRDYGQTDETTPFCVRTALAKKWGKPVGYNMYYSTSIADYERELWVNALAGFRVNYHPVFPCREDGRGWARKPLWRGRLMRGDCRVRLLNFISKTQVDCPVAVIFGHAGALNWAGASYADAGDGLAQAFWNTGFYADLIPTSEIGSSALRVDDDGYVRYGNQKYAAVVLYHPEFERAGTGEFFRKAAKGKTALYRLGAWTRDFSGVAFDGNAALPPEMPLLKGAPDAVTQVTAVLRQRGIAPHTPPGRSGQCRLIDGTVILTAGEKDVAGDPIQNTIHVDGHEVAFDAVGVAAVRLDKDGKLEALAAGGLKRFAVGKTTIELPERIDVALWKDEKGVWKGVLQDYHGPVPEALQNMCREWLRLDVPAELKEGALARPPKEDNTTAKSK